MVATKDGPRLGRFQKGVVVGPYGVGNVTRELYSEELVAVLKGERGIVLEHHMQHHIIVGVVGAVVVAVPVGRLHMHFDIAHPQGVADADVGVYEIGARITIERPWAFHNDRHPIYCAKLPLQQLVLPDILKEVFVHFHGMEA